MGQLTEVKPEGGSLVVRHFSRELLSLRCAPVSKEPRHAKKKKGNKKQTNQKTGKQTHKPNKHQTQKQVRHGRRVRCSPHSYAAPEQGRLNYPRSRCRRSWTRKLPRLMGKIRSATAKPGKAIPKKHTKHEDRTSPSDETEKLVNTRRTWSSQAV